LTAFQITNLSPEDAVDKLWYDHNIVSRQVKEIAAVRISTHFFNSEDELSYLVEAVSKIAS
jgi:selenocysteine lyase/cysteine desulfurase